MTETTSRDSKHHQITIIGTGTIGLSFVALHLAKHSYPVIVCDTRLDLQDHVQSTLPTYLPPNFEYAARLILTADLKAAVRDARVIHECLPETATLKQSIWKQVERYAPSCALLWSATSGVPASVQSEQMHDETRVCIVHPYNPPHIMPLLEVVPSPLTSQSVIDETLLFWRSLGREPVLIRKETTGFVANRLAFALFREAVQLVDSGVVGVEDLDSIVQNSMGPRWSVAGPFKSYHAGGGKAGLAGFMANIGGTVGDVWEDLGAPKADGEWRDRVCQQAVDAYGVVDTAERDRITRRVLEVIDDEKTKQKDR